MQDPRSGFVYNLTDLTTHGDFNFTSTSGNTNYTYTINVCGTSNVCSGAVCQTSQSTGKSFLLGLAEDSTLTITADDALTLTYGSGQMCHGIYPRSSVIIFQCDRYAGVGSPTFAYEMSNCTYVFNWPTAYACLPRVWEFIFRVELVLCEPSLC